MCCKQFKQKWGIKSHDCFSEETSAKENGKEFHIVKKKGKGNPKVCKIKVDACLIASADTKKCDYTFIVCETGEMVFLELKGVDVFTSVEQIRKTLGLFKEKISLEKVKITGFIVSGSMPRKSNTKFRDKQKEFYRDFKSDLIRSTGDGFYRV